MFLQLFRCYQLHKYYLYLCKKKSNPLNHESLNSLSHFEVLLRNSASFVNLLTSGRSKWRTGSIATRSNRPSSPNSSWEACSLQTNAARSAREFQEFLNLFEVFKCDKMLSNLKAKTTFENENHDAFNESLKFSFFIWSFQSLAIESFHRIL